jgi:hypothetical protein
LSFRKKKEIFIKNVRDEINAINDVKEGSLGQASKSKKRRAN